jgi:short-subunit dehydrogenase
MKGLPDYAGRTAIVTGASTGLGAEFARQLARRGMRVALVARREAELEKVASGIRAGGGDAIVVPCDVGERASVERVGADAIARLGRVDLLVNNAGYNTHGLFKDHPDDDIERMFRVNVLGQIWWIKAVLPAMRRRGEGWIVNLSSVAGKLGQPDEAVYASTKFAITGLSESLAYEFDPLGIHVLCVHPAVVRTEMFTPEVLARMPEVAKRAFIDPDVFCEAVLRALERGAYEVTVPRHVGFSYLFRLITPGLFRRATARMRLPVLPDLTS